MKVRQISGPTIALAVFTTAMTAAGAFFVTRPPAVDNTTVQTTTAGASTQAMYPDSSLPAASPSAGAAAQCPYLAGKMGTSTKAGSTKATPSPTGAGKATCPMMPGGSPTPTGAKCPVLSGSGSTASPGSLSAAQQIMVLAGESASSRSAAATK